MDSGSLRHAFLNFFKERGHAIVPSSSLVPDDPSVLLTTAGMQQFKPYFVGKADPMKDFGSLNTVSIQKSFRTSDIDEVGDERHLTFFEMMGNFSFGGYFKKEAIAYGYDFLKNVLGLQIDYVTVFDPEKVPEGDWRKRGVPFDEESYGLWEEIGMPESKIRREGIDNFWGPTGGEGPCGSTTEIYIDGIEVWNIVFNQFYCDKNAKLTPLKIQGVDTGMGLERLAMVSQNAPTIFETDLFAPLVDEIPTTDQKIKRILADHLRAVVHLIADGVEPSNKDRGYILRRLLRRAIFHTINIASAQAMIPLNSRIPEGWDERTYSMIHKIAERAIEISFFDIGTRANFIISVIDREMGRFLDLLKSNSELHKIIKDYQVSNKKSMTGDDAFKLSSTFGLPIDYIRDEAQKFGLEVDLDAFDAARVKHQEISRTGQERKFGGHGLILDTGELKAANEEELKIVTRLHTATHLLQAALRKVLGETVHQAGSDITVERTRFDFTFPRKLTPEELKSTERLINEAIEKDLAMEYKELPFQEAIATGALYSPREKYPAQVKVYSAWDSKTKEVFSRELCGGPHVTHTGEVGKVKIVKEEAVGAGIRRLRATVE